MIKKALYIILAVVALTSFASVEAQTTQNHSSIESTVQESCVVVREGTVTIYNVGEAKVYHVYSITGQQIRTVKVAQDSNVTIELPQGYYVVRCQQWARKVIVK